MIHKDVDIREIECELRKQRDRLAVDTATIPRGIAIDYGKRIMFATTDKKDGLIKFSLKEKKDRCTHEHVSKGECLYCGEKGILI